MDDYLEKFKALPKELRDAVSSQEKIKVLETIEKKYNLKLVKLVVRLMIKDIKWQDLEKFLISDFRLSSEKAKELKKDLAEKIFNEVIDYLTKDLVEEKISVTSPSAKNLKEVIKDIKEKLNLTFTDEILEKRFENIVNSYLKEIRNELQTEEILTRSKKIGGLEIPSQKAIEIVKILKEIYQKSQPSLKKEVEIGNHPEIAKLIEPKPVFLEKESKEESQTEVSLPETKIEIKRPEEKPIQIKEPTSDEKKVEDISFQPRVFGPIEELSTMRLVDLQRWGGKKTTEIILDKINLLGEESLTKKAQGIQAWQKSPLFKLYLEIGEEALEKKKTLKEIIDERKNQNRPTLEIDDWQAINELNEKLKF
ncbi:MAG: hypothetical protein ACK413_03300 [Patescibacteria group bacterium]